MKTTIIILVLCMSLGLTTSLNAEDSFNKVDLPFQFRDSYEMQPKFSSAVLKNLILAETNEDIEEAMEEVEEAMEEVEEALDKIEIKIEKSTPPIMVTYDATPYDTPLMGVYLSDLDFQDAYEMHYDYNYGVLLDGVVKGGGADNAGLMENDIIMEFNGVKVRYEDHLSRLIKSKNVGDSIEVKFFRDENIMKTTVILGSRKKKIPEEEVITKEGKIIRKLSPGHGGGSWIPVWFMPDDEFKDVNFIIKNMGFRPLDQKGRLLHGGGGKGPIGKGLFIGGMGAGYSIPPTKKGKKQMTFSVGYGGITLDKRIPISRKLIPAIGLMIGWGGYKMEFSNIDSTYNWNTLDDQLTNAKNNYIKMEKNYFLVQPKIACLYKLNSWLGFRAEVGYLHGFPFHNGWNAKVCDDTYEIEGSPNTKFNGFTYTIGPWFGF